MHTVIRLCAAIVRRAAWTPITVLGLLAIVFSISHVIPSDPAKLLAGENASPQQVQALRDRYGLDKPLLEQFGDYVSGVVHGDLGTSLYTQRPISDDIKTRIFATAELSFYAMVLSTIVGVGLGVLAALHRNTWFDHVIRVLTVGGYAIPAFWLAMLLQLFLSMKLGMVPLGGRVEGWGPTPITGIYTLDAVLRGSGSDLLDALLHLALPALTLAIPGAATITRFTRSGVVDVLNSGFVSYQTAMGIPWRRTVWKYILRGAMIGTVTQIGLVFSNMLAGAVVVETVFNWPGIGTYIVNSILNSDYVAIMGFCVFAGIMVMVVNLAVDLLQMILDPRVR